LFYSASTGEGRTSGKIRLFVDGKETEIDGIAVEFSFADDSNGNKFNMSERLKNGSFCFNKNQYATYHIKFFIEPNVWGDAGQAIHFETQYFCAYNRAITEFDIQVNIVLNEVKSVELIAGLTGDRFSKISSGKIPIDILGMDISVRIPSP
jgi:hypothetical protein